MFKVNKDNYLIEGTDDYNTYQEALTWLGNQEDSDHYTWLIGEEDMELIRMLDEDYKLHAKSKLEIERHKLEKYLAETDYVITKINEAIALDEDVDALKVKYSEILTNRKSARARINEIESEIEAL